MRHRLPASAALALALAAAACSPSRPPWLRSAPQRTWVETYLEAQRRVAAGDFRTADSLLAHFAAEYPEAPESVESRYWRALYLLDPANPKSSPRESARLFALYLGEPATLLHVSEATSLHRTALALDSLATAATAARVAADSAQAGVAAREKAAAEETQKLKDELARAQAELERIKKRLTRP